ncbi:hypothetical protein [Ralstonia sp. UNC404CL21Col]|uniref:hypothetical protein n=1 Tax=Ralstonia sp. UNC404CL21Col TaxID=1380362 RepID=UPI000A662861|nr:hypothetical protein [Ralstonia sp. UNC404CL21Col]
MVKMTGNASKLQPQSPYWYEDLPGPTVPLRSSDKNDQPNLALDLNYVNEDVFELSRASSIQRGFGLMFGVGVSIAFVAMLPFIGQMYQEGHPEESPVIASVLALMLLELAVLLLHLIKRGVRTPRDLPVLFDRKNRKVFV